MINIIIKASATLLLITMSVACREASTGEKKGAAISYTVLQLPSGWGYSIYKNGILLIRQEAVPAVAGATAFACERDAALVAREVVKKLNLGASPRITVAELRQLGVKY